MKKILSVLLLAIVSCFVMKSPAQIMFKNMNGVYCAIMFEGSSVRVGLSVGNAGALSFDYNMSDGQCTLFGDWTNGLFVSNDMSYLILFLNGTQHIFNLDTTYQGQGYIQPYNAPSSNNQSSGWYKETCSFCNGRGWRVGSRGTVYSGLSDKTHWCSECGIQVDYSHSHDQCPSCGGKGYIEKYR